MLSNLVDGAFVTAGTQLAVAYDPSEIFVTARVDDTDIGDVRAGQRVDIEVDAAPGIALTGYVWEVQAGVAALFSGDRGAQRPGPAETGLLAALPGAVSPRAPPPGPSCSTGSSPGRWPRWPR